MHGPDQHLQNHIQNSGVKDGNNTLHVVGVCSNPVRYHSRLRLAREWIRAMANTPNVHLTIVEAAYGARFHELEKVCKEFTNVDHLRVRTNSEAWIKESMMNLGFRNIVVKYPEAKYFDWHDMDVFHPDSNWAQETIHQLQHFEVVQPWSDALDLGPLGGVSRHFKSFGFQKQKRAPMQKHPSQTYYEYAHSGFAWACTRKFIEAMWGAGGSSGPLMDWCLLGSADHHMAFAMIGETKDTIHAKMHPSFFRKCYEWQERVLTVTKGEVGFTPGRIEHKFHGPKNRRYYRERWQIFVDHCYDPDKMLTHDERGLALLVGNHKLEHAIHQYNVSRFEDSIEEF